MSIAEMQSMKSDDFCRVVCSACTASQFFCQTKCSVARYVETHQQKCIAKADGDPQKIYTYAKQHLRKKIAQ